MYNIFLWLEYYSLLLIEWLYRDTIVRAASMLIQYNYVSLCAKLDILLTKMF